MFPYITSSQDSRTSCTYPPELGYLLPLGNSQDLTSLPRQTEGPIPRYPTRPDPTGETEVEGPTGTSS